MNGITISDSENGLLSFDLIDILNAIGDRAAKSGWKISNVEAVGNAAQELERLGDSHEEISGNELLSLSSDLVQIIDGTFEAYLSSGAPWLVIRAVDSSEFDVESDDLQILRMLTEMFHNVRDIAATDPSLESDVEIASSAD